MRLNWHVLHRPDIDAYKYRRELIILCDGVEIPHTWVVDEEAGRVERALLNAKGEPYSRPDRSKGTACEILYGKVEITLKPDASDEARIWIQRTRAGEITYKHMQIDLDLFDTNIKTSEEVEILYDALKDAMYEVMAKININTLLVPAIGVTIEKMTEKN